MRIGCCSKNSTDAMNTGYDTTYYQKINTGDVIVDEKNDWKILTYWHVF